MANKRVFDVPELATTPDANDFVNIMDVSDLTESGDGTLKKIKISNLTTGSGTQDLQSVLDEGGYAEKEAGNSYVNLLGGIADDREITLRTSDADFDSSVSIGNTGASISSEEIGVMSASLGINSGELELRKTDVVAGVSTTIGIETPIAETAINFPAKTAGTYTLATLDDARGTDWRKSYGIDYFNDFLAYGQSAIGGGAADGISYNYAAGAGALNSVVQGSTVVPNETSSNVGIGIFSTGTTSSGVSGTTVCGTHNGGVIVVGNGEILYDSLIEIETLSTVTERFVNLFGLSTFITTTNPTNLIGFTYDEGGIAGLSNFTASANWQTVTTNALTKTVTDTGVPVVTTGFVKLSIIVNAGGTSVAFYINGVLVSTHTTNIPTGATKRLVNANAIFKTAGTTSRTMYMDYVKLRQTLTTPRT